MQSQTLTMQCKHCCRRRRCGGGAHAGLQHMAKRQSIPHFRLIQLKALRPGSTPCVLGRRPALSHLRRLRAGSDAVVCIGGAVP